MRGGSIVEWGTSLPSGSTAPPLPPGLGYTDVTGGNGFMIARRSDGTLVTGIECEDHGHSVEASAAISAKRAEAPRTVLPTGPPSLDVAGSFFLVSMPVGGHVPNGRIVRFDGDYRDPFLVALDTSRLLI